MRPNILEFEKVDYENTEQVQNSERPALWLAKV